jgi:deoxyadenosine/deoxycytidine kinase
MKLIYLQVEMWRNCQGHNLLKLMYDDPKRHSFTFQSYVQLTMVKLHNQPTDKPIRMMERSLFRQNSSF